ncbi:hypothetical protein M2118_000443 [Aurantimicrobium minutum]|nr:hypothetical protein [Aurantimicrobium minutum]MDH6277492.1 hypothetical protein [Aurantimicrobium minutum]
MSLTFIAGFVVAAVPALFMGVNNGATMLGVIVMAFAGTRLLRGAK